SAHAAAWRPALWAMAGAIVLSVVIYVRSPVGVIVLPLVAALIALVAGRAPAGFVRFSLQFLGVLGAMSMLRDFDYLFTERAVIAGQAMLSDTGQIEAALGLPHWVWAGLILGISGLMIGASLRYALAEKRLRAVPKKLPPNVTRFRRPRR
ncbi:MAG: M50 family metallopeptidase, partial [Erythrobacter sp.]|nr:M50 family metallopeptidase [Erythrobacter sp.]